MTIEKMKEWLEAMEKSLPRLAPYGEQDWLDSKAAITSLRQAIAEAEQEPVAFAAHGVVNWIADKQFMHEAELYTHPPAQSEQEPVAWNRGVPPVHPQQKEGETFIVSYEATKPRHTEQEPAAWQVMVEDEAMKEFPIKDMAHDWCLHQKLSGSPHSYWIRPLYTTPQPQRTWVGLTDDEYTELWGKRPDLLNFFRKIEAKLKEKNT